MGRTMRSNRLTYALGGAAACLLVLALAALVAAALFSRPSGAGAQVPGVSILPPGTAPAAPPPATQPPVTSFIDDPNIPCEAPPLAWLDSKPLGRPFKNGRLVSGVQLPEEGDYFFTWDFPFETTPNRSWRRYGADGTIRILLRVLCDFRLAHPEAPRIGVADLSRTLGGEFGRRFGGHGHASHQNGLDIDVLYPRFDRVEEAATSASQIDRVLSQDLVRRFVRAGAENVFVGPATGLKGPKKIVGKLVFHDDHMHVRIPQLLATKPAPGVVPGV